MNTFVRTFGSTPILIAIMMDNVPSQACATSLRTLSKDLSFPASM